MTHMYVLICVCVCVPALPRQDTCIYTYTDTHTLAPTNYMYMT